MNSSLQPTIEKLILAKESATSQATALKDISVTKANEILSTQYGAVAVQGIDNTSVLVTRLLDHFFPPIEGEEDMPGTLELRSFFFILLFAGNPALFLTLKKKKTIFFHIFSSGVS